MQRWHPSTTSSTGMRQRQTDIMEGEKKLNVSSQMHPHG